MSATLQELDRARLDPVVFADVLLGESLWPHQVEVIRSSARYRVLCAGRRAGKTRVFGVLSLHTAFSRPGAKVLIVSSGDDSAKNMFADVSGMVQRAPLLRGSVVDDLTRELTLTNGSQIKCVPSSMRQVRSAEADLLIVDEAGFVDQEIWEAAEPVVGARKGARVLISSTPWRGPGHFFHDLWRQGMDAPDLEVSSWHWPSTVSPLVDQVWLEGVRSRSSSEYFEREYLAKWTGERGGYFSEAEIMDAVADYDLLDAAGVREVSPWRDGPGFTRALPAVAGIDWGFRKDANAVTVLSRLEDGGENERLDGGALFVSSLSARSGWLYQDFVDHVVELCRAYRMQVVASETNGVGDAPTQALRTALHRGRVNTFVADVWTDVRRKQAGFGKLRMLLQQGSLVLPRHPELLKQLRALEFEQLQGGSVRISVPERAGHDDIAMSLMQAVSCIAPTADFGSAPALGRAVASWSVTGGGVRVPLPARPSDEQRAWWIWPQGSEKGESW